MFAHLCLIACLFCLLPLTAAAGSSKFGDDNKLSNLLGGTSGSQPLPAEEAFPFTAQMEGPGQVAVNWDTQSGYYLYRDKMRFELTGTESRIAEVQLPQGEVTEDAYFGRMEVYYDPVRAEVRLDQALTAPATLTAHFQGCAEQGICYPPMSQTVQLQPPGGTSTTASSPLPLAAGIALAALALGVGAVSLRRFRTARA